MPAPRRYQAADIRRPMSSGVGWRCDGGLALGVTAGTGVTVFLARGLALRRDATVVAAEAVTIGDGAGTALVMALFLGMIDLHDGLLWL
jgi:hypothetical protein